MHLHIAVEAFWRGSMLDTVTPLATLPLRPIKDLPGSLATDEPFALKLTNGQTVGVRCAASPAGRYFLGLKTSDAPLLEVAADAPIYLEIRLPDGKLYAFRLSAEA